MTELISAEDGLGAIFFKKVSELVDEIVQKAARTARTNRVYLDTRQTDEVLERAGIRTFCYDGPRRDFFETGFAVGVEAAERGTNVVLTWNEMEGELVAFFAKDEGEARRRILEARKALLALRRDGPPQKAKRKSARGPRIRGGR